jgi:hypothetical protein
VAGFCPRIKSATWRLATRLPGQPRTAESDVQGCEATFGPPTHRFAQGASRSQVSPFADQDARICRGSTFTGSADERAVLVKPPEALLGIGRLVRSGERINLERADLLRTAAANRELRGPLQGFLP